MIIKGQKIEEAEYVQKHISKTLKFNLAQFRFVCHHEYV